MTSIVEIVRNLELLENKTGKFGNNPTDVANFLASHWFNTGDLPKVIDETKGKDTMRRNLDIYSTGCRLPGCNRELLLKTFMKYSNNSYTYVEENGILKRVMENVRVLWSGFPEGQFIGDLFGVLLNLKDEGIIARALEQVRATQNWEHQMGSWPNTVEAFKEYFTGKPYNFSEDEIESLVSEVWDRFSSNFARLPLRGGGTVHQILSPVTLPVTINNYFPVTLFTCPLYIENRLKSTTFLRKELYAMKTNYFGIVFYTITPSKITLFNTTFNGNFVSYVEIIVYSTDPNEPVTSTLDIRVAPFYKEQTEGIKDFLIKLSKSGINKDGTVNDDERMKEFRQMAQMTLTSGGGRKSKRRKWTRRRKSKRRKWTRRRKSKRRKWTRRRKSKRK